MSPMGGILERTKLFRRQLDWVDMHLSQRACSILPHRYGSPSPIEGNTYLGFEFTVVSNAIVLWLLDDLEVV
jgi:hypothetical protein